MTSYMIIDVRVVANRAQAKLAALRAQQAGFVSGVSAANKQPPLARQHIASLLKFGNQLQWTGRMLMYNFTLPIVAAGVAATIFALDQEKAFVHVAKVYGDTQAAAKQFRKEMGLGQKAAEALADSYEMEELAALDKAFTAISEHYGIQKKEVNEVAGAWAAAGASGLDLAKAVDQTMQAMIIGDMKSADATRALISIQAQYNLSTKELQATLANLNSVENQTGAQMKDLIIGFEKAAGMARLAGIETNQLAAYMAALVPATGTASTAGNALKTIFSRLLSPTKETAEVMEAMGLNIHDVGWQSATVAEQLDMMSVAFEGLTKKQQGATASMVASRWQVNRFSVLMKELRNDNGYYAKALEASKDQGDSFIRMQKELNTVLESNPRKLQRMLVMLQNASVEIIQPLIPHIIYLTDKIAGLAQSFSKLEPSTQKLILFFLVLLAAVGPIVRYIGALGTLFYVLGTAIMIAGAGLGKLGGLIKILFSPIAKLGTLVMGALGLIGSAFTGMMAVFGSAIGGIVVGLGYLIPETSKTAGILTRIFAVLVKGPWKATVFLMTLQWTKALGSMLIAFGGFRAKLALLWAAASASSTSIWGAMWLILKGMSVRGFATLAATSMMAPIVAVFLRMRALLVGIWVGQWAALKAAAIAFWVQAHAIAIGGSVAHVGIFSKMRTAVILIFATMHTAVLGILRAMALSMLVFAGGAATGFVGVLKGLIPFLLKWGKWLVSPWSIAILAILGVLYAFRDQLYTIWNNIISYLGNQSSGIGSIFAAMRDGILRAFYALPQGVQSAMVAVVTIVRNAALAVYEWFSYINPFASHSPSLVDSVKNGMDSILGDFSRLSQIKDYVASAYAEIKRFGELTANLGVNAEVQDQKEDRKTLKKAGAGDALASYNKLTNILKQLNGVLKELEGKIAAQERVVENWQQKVDEANEALDRQQKKLDQLNAKLQGYQDALNAAQADLDYFANAPLVGMRAMEDQIFANTMAQTKLRLEMMNMEDVVGTYDDLKQKMDSVNGLQEILRGTQTDLRNAGAGSEILGQYDAEIKKLEEQKDTYTDTADKLNAMQIELTKLQREAEKLDLVKAMNFAELEYAIARAADQTKELTFDEIMSGIAGANAEIAKYGPLVDQATAAVAAQEQAVDEATAARDRYQERLDAETAQLEVLRSKYNEVEDAISAIETAINNVVAAAEKMNAAMQAKKDAEKAKKDAAKAQEEAAKAKDKKDEGAKGAAAGAKALDELSPGMQNFVDAGKAKDYADPGGKGIPPRDDWSNQADKIDKWTEDLANETADLFANVNPFAPLKEKALEVWEWVKNKAQDVADKIKEFFTAAFDGVSVDGGKIEKMKNALEGAVEFVTKIAKEILKPFEWAYELFWPLIQKFGEKAWEGLKDLWEKIGPKLGEFKDLWGPIGEAIGNFWNVVKPILGLLIGFFLMISTGLISAISEAIQPAIEMISTILGGIIDFIRGVVQIIVGIFTLDLGMILSGVGAIFEGLWGIITGIFGGAIDVVWNLVQGFVFGIRDFFVWLWEKLVGHSIIPDIIDGIIGAFERLADLAQWVWDNVLKPVWEFFKSLWDDHLSGWLSALWGNVKDGWNDLKKAGQWVWDNVLKPVWDFFKSLWEDHLSGWLTALWDKVKAGWDNLKKAGQWVWDNVLKPVWDFFKSLWADYVKPALENWWEGIKLAWALILGLGTWVWNNALKPVFDTFVGLWTDHVKPKLEGWWENIKTAWDNLKKLGEWITNNVMDPVKDAFTNGWQSIKTWFTDHADILFNPVAGVVNFVLSAVNFLIRGLNKVADILPGDLWNIDEIAKIEKMAAGGIPGRKASRGFVTSGARAIVGEGKANYPEFVIPTDPTHRNRAKSLLALAAQKMGMDAAAASVRNSTRTDEHGVPMFGIGGWLSEAWDDTKNLGKKIARLPKQVVGSIMDKVLDGAEKTVNSIGYQPIESPPEMAISKLRGWVTDFDDNIAKKLDSMTPVGGSVPVADPTSPGALQYWGGGTFTRRFVAHMERAEELAGSGVNVMQGGFRPATSYSGTSHQADAVDFQVHNALIRAFRQVGIAAGDRTGLGNWAPHTHAIPGPGAGTAGGSAVWQWTDYIARGGQNQALDSPWGLKAGGIVRKRAGGTIVRLGEGANDEAVTPLPHGWQNIRVGNGVTHIHVNGDLSFPNITSPNDAELFIRNLENLAEN